MVKPIAFADEQIDADLWQIVGPWEQAQPHTFRDSIGPPLRLGFAGADKSDVLLSIGDGTRPASNSDLPKDGTGSSRKFSVRPFASRRRSMVAATVVAVGTAFYGFTNNVTEHQKPVLPSSARTDGKGAVQEQARTRPTYPSEIAILEGPTQPSSVLRQTRSLELRNRTPLRLTIAKGGKRMASRIGGSAIAKRDTFEPKTSADEPSLNNPSQGFAASNTTETSSSSAALADAKSETLSTAFADKYNGTRDRHDSVQALRALRRQ